MFDAPVLFCRSEIRCPIDFEGGERGTDWALGDIQPDLTGSDGVETQDTAGADSRAFGNGLPGLVDARLQGEGFDALAQGDVFLETNAIEGRGISQVEGEAGGVDVVVRGPVGVSVAVGEQVGVEGVAIAPYMGGGYGFALGQVRGKGLIQDVTQFHQASDIGLVDQAATVGRQVQ